MKPRQTALNVVLVLTLLFFVVLNTAYYWEGMVGGMALIIFLCLALLFVVLIITLISYIYFLIKERFKNKLRNYTFIVLILVLSLTIYKPFGLLDFESFEGDDSLVAYREGVAGCAMTFKLKDTGRFFLRETCFGVDKTRGSFKIKGDTIFLSEVKSRDRTLSHAIIKEGGLELYKSRNDTLPFYMSIIKNHLQKKVSTFK